jgi:hypothetical protein
MATTKPRAAAPGPRPFVITRLARAVTLDDGLRILGQGNPQLAGEYITRKSRQLND